MVTQLDTDPHFLFLEVSFDPRAIDLAGAICRDTFVVALQITSRAGPVLYGRGTLIGPTEGARTGCEEPARVSRGGLAQWQELRAKEMLQVCVGSGLSLERLASSCALSVRHFTRAFRNSTGTTPHRWLLLMRVERAKTLLAHSSKRLAEIALECGFSDPSHFSRSFLREVGCPPGLWRRAHKQ